MEDNKTKKKSIKYVVQIVVITSLWITFGTFLYLTLKK
jgi:hypothetical protein